MVWAISLIGSTLLPDRVNFFLPNGAMVGARLLQYDIIATCYHFLGPAIWYIIRL